MEITARNTCRVCKSDDLTPLFSLGEQYVSDFVDKDHIKSGIKCPIDLERCNNCTLVQLKHTAPQEILYSRHYWYRSGVTQTMRDALRDVTAAAERLAELKPGDVVLDIGSNDGTLLRSYTKENIVRVGVEPAENLAEEGRKGVEVFINDFWSADSYGKAMTVGTRPKVITACGMFYDLEDPNPFVADIAKVLHPEGVFIAQLMCLKNMLSVGDVGNFAHEHLEYYSLDSLYTLLGRHNLQVFDIETNSVNGESYRLYIQHYGGSRTVTDRCYQTFNNDREVCSVSNILQFEGRMKRNRDLCVKFITEEVAKGKRVWVYGASTKGNVILQYYGLGGVDGSTGDYLIEGAADRSPEKWEKYTIGTGIPIQPELTFRRFSPDYALVLPYAFLSEFLEREAEWRSHGGKFIVPLPEFKVI